MQTNGQAMMNAGQAMQTNGQAMMDSANMMQTQGQTMMDNGDKMIAAGQSMMGKGQASGDTDMVTQGQQAGRSPSKQNYVSAGTPKSAYLVI